MCKVDKKHLFFTAKREATTRVDIYRVDLKSKVLQRISYGPYSFSGVQVSEDGKTVAATLSNYRTPSKLVCISVPSKGDVDPAKHVKLIYDSKGEKFDQYAIALPELEPHDGH